MANFKKSILFYITAFLIMAVLVSSYMLSGVFARYAKSGTSNDFARVASFDVAGGDGVFETSYAVELDPTVEYELADAFTVTNSSEVDVRCYIKMESLANLPLIFEWNIDGTEYVAKANEALSIDLKSTSAQKSADLTVRWDGSQEQNKAFIYRRQVDKLTLNLVCEQID